MRFAANTSIIVAAATLLSSCANNTDMRFLAQQTADASTHYSDATGAFASAQSRAAGYDAMRLNNLRMSTLSAQADTDRLQRAWSLGRQTKKLHQFSSVTDKKTPDILAALLPTPEASAETRKGVNLSKSVKAYRALAEKPEAMDQAIFLGSYAQAVQTELDALKTKAAKDAAKSSEPAPK